MDEVWSRIPRSPFSEDTRNAILSEAAQELEFSAHSMSTTVDGYNARADCKVDAIRMLRDQNVWMEEPGAANDDAEDAHDIADIIRRLCKTTGKSKSKQF